MHTDPLLLALWIFWYLQFALISFSDTFSSPSSPSLAFDFCFGRKYFRCESLGCAEGVQTIIYNRLQTPATVNSDSTIHWHFNHNTILESRTKNYLMSETKTLLWILLNSKKVKDILMSTIPIPLQNLRWPNTPGRRGLSSFSGGTWAGASKVQ